MSQPRSERASTKSTKDLLPLQGRCHEWPFETHGLMILLELIHCATGTRHTSPSIGKERFFRESPLPVRQPTDQFRSTHGLGNKIALCQIAPGATQKGPVDAIFNSFSDDCHAEFLTHTQTCAI